MMKISTPAASAIVTLLLLGTAPLVRASDTPLSTIGVSKVRIVRLSEVKGAVQIDLNSGQGFENAMVNLPIVEQNRLQTGTGVAEVEFEDNSTLRLAPDTLVEFPQLELSSSGAKLSSVRVLKGMVYVSMVDTRINHFSLLFGERKLELPPMAHIRLQIEPPQAELAVLGGPVQINGDSSPIDVPKKKTAIIPLDGQGEPQIAKNVAATDFDDWDHEAADYHKRFATYAANANSPSGYGVSDMGYYGGFVNAGDCGSMWRPHFASAAWDPFSNGAWAYYPNAGYSWVSPYPWGWAPYHSGSWAYCDGTGWGWLPGGTWNGLNNAPATLISKPGLTILPHPPNRPPRFAGSTFVMVNLKPLTPSSPGVEDSFVFRKDSAGLGVPRGSLGRLDKFSQRTVQHGTATTPIYLATSSNTITNRPSQAGMNRPTAGATGNFGVGSIHRGYAPVASATSSISSLPGSATPSSSTSSGSVSSSSVSMSHAGSSGSSSGGGHPH